MKLFHTCKFDIHDQKEYEVMYTNKWIIYNQIRCKCGKHQEEKMCGTIELSDVPDWALKNN